MTAETVHELCRKTPSERLARLGDRDDRATEIVTALEEAYEEFLQCVQRPEDDVLEEFATDDVRRERLDSAATYGTLIYELLVSVVPEERLRYLVV